MTASITSIVYTPKTAPTSAECYIRVAVEQIELVAGHGIKGDKKAGRNPQRHLNIMSQNIVDQLAGEGFKTAPGELGEQLIMSGLDINSLRSGDRLQLGDSAVVQITKPRVGCAKFASKQRHALSETTKRLGMLATVITGGTIRIGDAVLVLVEAT